MKTHSFEKLEAYRIALDLAIEVYVVTREFPKNEQFGLTSQIRRAVVSVGSNLAEGSGRISAKDKAHFTAISYGSLMEMLCQFQIAQELGFISEVEFQKIRQQTEKLSVYLSKLRSSQLKTSGTTNIKT